MEQNNILQLKKLAAKVTGKSNIPGGTIADVLSFIEANYSGGTGGGGATILNFILYPNEDEIIKSGEIILSDGTSIELELLDPDELTLKSVAGSSVGMTTVSVSPAITTGNVYKYLAGSGTIPRPAKNEYLTDWIDWDGVSEIEATKGNYIAVAECTASGKLQKFGITKSNASLV